MNAGWDALLAGVLLLLVAVAAGWALYAQALRVDRLHRQVLGSRATLETQLVHRAQAAAELAASGCLDADSSHLLSRAAHDALECEAPLVEDGLDPSSVAPDPDVHMRTRAAVESDLSRVSRAVLDPQTRCELMGDPLAAQCLSRLDRAGYRLVLARRFHDTHVSETRRLRRSWVVRLFRLAGRAPLPGTFDMDDDLGPEHPPARHDEERA
ncbi:hypothetical protein [Actinomyces respiraculi]|uniref:hypothetical protein n=1 Tax=Actinomyces respiraculi TaxID=2744574 RepID=UPI0014244C75|nr:hypothetical protein [Actinomyces respiraculi]